MIKIGNSVSKEVEEKFKRDLLATVSDEFISKLAKQINKNYSNIEDKKLENYSAQGDFQTTTFKSCK